MNPKKCSTCKPNHGAERISIKICNNGYYLHHERYHAILDEWSQYKGDILLKHAINGVVED